MEKQNLKRLWTLADDLAIMRTKLANERTLLAYLRTFIGAFAAGVGLIKFVEDETFVIIGYLLMFASPLILVVGLYRVFRARRAIRQSCMNALKTHQLDEEKHIV